MNRAFRVLAATTAAALSLSLAACGGSDSSDSADGAGGGLLDRKSVV